MSRRPGYRPGRNRNSKGDLHQGDITRGFVDMLAYRPADYSVVEGFWGTEGNGPQWGEDVQHNIVMAGADPVAVDTVGSLVMGYNPEDLELPAAFRSQASWRDAPRANRRGRATWQDVTRPFPLGKGRSGNSYPGEASATGWFGSAESQRSGADGWVAVASDDRFVDLTLLAGGSLSHGDRPRRDHL